MSIGATKSKVSKADLVEREIQMQVLLRKQQQESRSGAQGVRSISNKDFLAELRLP